MDTLRVSRSNELASLLGQAGDGAVAVVTGPTASGKSRLVDLLAVTARQLPTQVLRATCRPYDAFDRLIVPRQLFGPQVQPGLAQDVQGLLAGALRQAAAGPLVVIIDDLRHADRESKDFVRDLAFNVKGNPVLLVCTDRQRPSGDMAELWAEIKTIAGFRQISLPALSATDVIGMAEHELGLGVDEKLAADICELSNGSPPLVKALLVDHVREGKGGLADGGQPITGQAYCKAVLDCLYALDPNDRDIAETMAVIGLSESTAVFDEVVGGSAPGKDAVIELTACGLISAHGFRSASARQVVLSTISAARRSALSGRAAESSAAASDDLASWMSAVIQLRPRTPQLGRAGDGRSPRLQTLCQAKAMIIQLEHQISELSADAEESGAELRASQIFIACDFPGLLPSLHAKMPSAHPRLTVHSARYGAAWSLGSVLRGGSEADAVVDAAGHALRSLDPAHCASQAVGSALVALMHEGRTDLAAFWSDIFLAAAESRGDTEFQAELTAFSAAISMRSGDTTAAVSLAEHALDLMPPAHWGIKLGMPLSTLLQAATFNGRHSVEVKQLDHRPPASLFDSRFGLHYLYARGHAYLASGEHLRGLADFVRCGRLMALWKIDSQELPRWRLAVASAHVAMNDYDKAISAITEALAPGQQGALSAQTLRRCEVIFTGLVDATGSPQLASMIESLCGEGIDTPTGTPARYQIRERYAGFLDRLSSAEQQVALLAANGTQNRTIARELSITVSTVEQHLTRSYRKLQVVGRSELRARLG